MSINLELLSPLFKDICFFLEIAILILCILCLIKRIQVHQSNPSKGSKYLMFFYFSMGMLPFGLIFDYFFRNIFDIQVGYFIAFLGANIFNICLLLVAIEMFYKFSDDISKIMRYFKYSVIICEISLMIFGLILVFLLSIEISNVVILLVLIQSVFSFFVDIIVIVNSIQLTKKLKTLFVDELHKRAIKNFTKFSFLLSLMYIFAGIDSIFLYITIWGVIGNILFLFGVYFSYQGFIVPIKKREN
ncbi:MAG: hypothetical protein GY870_17850 [archaeon]|nr:hypothetical protein [archaeon]